MDDLVRTLIEFGAFSSNSKCAWHLHCDGEPFDPPLRGVCQGETLHIRIYDPRCKKESDWNVCEGSILQIEKIYTLLDISVVLDE